MLIFDNSIFYLNENVKEMKSISIIDDQFDKSLNYKNFEIIKDSAGKNYFVRKNLGEVFEIKDNTFKRLDKSSHIKTSAGSFKIFHKGHILSFFGRDEYEASNFILDFNQDSKEWNKVVPSEESDIPIPRVNAYFKKINDNVHYFGGKTFSEENSTESFLDDYFIFNLKDKTHKKYNEILVNNFRKSETGSIVDIDSYRSIFFSKNIFLLMDFKKLTFEKQSIFSVFGSNSKQFLSANVVKFENKIYYLNDEKLNGQVNLKSKELSDIIEYFNNPSPLFLNSKTIDYKFINKHIIIYVFLSGLIFIFFTGFRLLKLKKFKKQNILKQSNYLTFDKKIVRLDFEESCIMDFLIGNIKVKLSNISELECFDDYSDTYRKVYIPKLLISLDDKFKILGQKKSKILSLEKTKNKYDKRIIEYQLKGNVVIYKGWLNYIFRF